MKKNIFFLLMAFLSLSLNAQKVKPAVITVPSVSFLKTLQQAAQTISISPKDFKGLNANQVAFYKLIKSATGAASWDKPAYKTFIKQATPLIKALGILSDPDDGGEIFSDPDDGGEVFSSSKLVSKSLSTFCSACSICIGCPTKNKN